MEKGSDAQMTDEQRREMDARLEREEAAMDDEEELTAAQPVDAPGEREP